MTPPKRTTTRLLGRVTERHLERWAQMATALFESSAGWPPPSMSEQVAAVARDGESLARDILRVLGPKKGRNKR